MYKHSICFTGSAHHFPWQIGVALYLQRNYDLTDCSFIGASAGSFVSCLLAMEIPMTEFVSKWVKDLYQVFRISSTGCYTIYHDSLKSVASKYIQEDCYKKANHRLFVSITKISCKGYHNELVHAFDSNEDLYDAICASSHIPFINSPSLFYMFRNNLCIDGAFSYNWIKLKEHNLLIQPYKWNLLKKYTYLLTGLVANSEKQFYSLVMQGYVDAKNNDVEFMKLGLTKKSAGMQSKL